MITANIKCPSCKELNYIEFDQDYELTQLPEDDHIDVECEHCYAEFAAILSIKVKADS